MSRGLGRNFLALQWSLLLPDEPDEKGLDKQRQMVLMDLLSEVLAQRWITQFVSRIQLSIAQGGSRT